MKPIKSHTIKRLVWLVRVMLKGIASDMKCGHT